MKRTSKPHASPKLEFTLEELSRLEEKELRAVDDYVTYAIRFGFVNNAIDSDLNPIEQLLEKAEIAKQTIRTCFYQIKNPIYPKPKGKAK